MAYGYLCARCGYQQASHFGFGELVKSPDKPRRGFKTSLADCRGFVYQKEDEDGAVAQFIGDPVNDFPDYLRERAEVLMKKEDSKGVATHSVFAIIAGEVVDIGS